jgi:hypothetical protein
MPSRRTPPLAGLAVLLLGLGVPARAGAYECPASPPPGRTEEYRGFLGGVFEMDGQELPYRLFVPANYDP